MKTSTSDASPNDQLDVSLKEPGHKTLDVNSSITDAIIFNVDNPFSSRETTFTSEQIQHRNAYEKIAYSIICNPINGTIVSGPTLMKTSKPFGQGHMNCHFLQGRCWIWGTHTLAPKVTYYVK